MASHALIEVIDNLRAAMDRDGVDSRKELPEELFIFATTLMPVSNVDLFLTNDKGQVLLSWRDDAYYGSGWHITGGA